MSDIEMMRQLLNNAEIEKVQSEFNFRYKSFTDWQNRAVVLCGFSPYARQLINSLLEQGASIERLLIIDTDESSCAFYRGVEICTATVLNNCDYRHGIFNDKSTVFIICSNPYISHYANLLVGLGKQNVLTYHLLCLCDKRYDYPLERYNSSIIVARIEHLLQNKGFYMDFLNQLADNESKTIMRKWIMYHLTLLAEYCRVEAICPPYFGQTFLHPENYRVFADLGGFNGDTLRDFLSMQIDFDEYWFFEADEDLYKEALNTSNDSRIRYNNLAVGRSEGMVSFAKADDKSTTGAVSEEGLSNVNMNTLDNISSFAGKFTAIKMDIEGGEADALYGAEHIIRENHPVLIVSAEHKPCDIKELSEIILKFNRGYKFYLRCCMSSLYTDLTMYAVFKGDDE